MEAFDRFLKKFPHYTPQVLEEVTPYLSIKELNDGEYFLREGKVCRSIAFIEQGLLRLFYLNDGKEVTTCFCKENTITCSYRSMVNKETSDLAIQAIEASTLIVLPYQALLKLYEQNLFWQQVGRLAIENEYLATECHNRFITDLSATARYLQILENEPDILQRVPLNYLASYLQLTPETLSRTRNKLARN